MTREDEPDDFDREFEEYLGRNSDFVERMRACREFQEDLPDLEDIAEGNVPWGSALKTATTCPTDGVPMPEPSPEVPSHPPRSIGKYVIIARLGSGGQAEVFRAVHPTLQKDVVIKWSHWKAQDNPAFREALLSEGRILAALDHPNLARVYDLDFHEDRPFLVLELLRGQSLAQTMADSRHSPRQAAAIVASVAGALAYLHEKGVTHLDVKPENILREEGGGVRLIDLGLACVRNSLHDKCPAEGEIRGTIPFTAPEQARGDSKAIGSTSDIFSLGAVLYWMLVGEAPFYREGDSVQSALEKATRCEFDREALHNAEIPPQLRRICLKAMAPEPGDRYRSAAKLASALEAFVRRRALFRILAGTVLVVAFAAAAFLLLRNPTPEGGIFEYGLVERGFGRGKNLLGPDEVPPLRTGDSLTLSWFIPEGLEPTLFWLDSQGALHAEEFAVVADGKGGRKLRYPRNPEKFEEIAGEPGTEVIFLCARKGSAVTREEALEILGGTAAWPSLSGRMQVHFDATRVWSEPPGTRSGPAPGEGSTRGPGGEVEAPTGILTRAEALCQRLRAAGCDFVRGIAFPHLR